MNPATNVIGAGQPQVLTLSCKEANAENYLFKKIIKAWPMSTWTQSGMQPVVVMMERHTGKIAWNQCYFTANISQSYSITVRVYYFDKALPSGSPVANS